MDELEVKTLQLTAKQYAVAYLIDRGFTGGQLQAEVEYCAYKGAIQLVMHFKAWGEDDEPRLLADYPATLWEHVKAKLGLKHRRLYVWQQETVIYPSLPMDKYQSVIHVRTWTGSKLA